MSGFQGNEVEFKVAVHYYTVAYGRHAPSCEPIRPRYTKGSNKPFSFLGLKAIFMTQQMSPDDRISLIEWDVWGLTIAKFFLKTVFYMSLPSIYRAEAVCLSSFQL